MGVGPSSCIGRPKKKQVSTVIIPGRAVPAVHRVNLVMIEQLPPGRWIPEPSHNTKLSDREQQLVARVCGV